MSSKDLAFMDYSYSLIKFAYTVYILNEHCLPAFKQHSSHFTYPLMRDKWHRPYDSYLGVKSAAFILFGIPNTYWNGQVQTYAMHHI